MFKKCTRKVTSRIVASRKREPLDGWKKLDVPRRYVIGKPSFLFSVQRRLCWRTGPDENNASGRVKFHSQTG